MLPFLWHLFILLDGRVNLPCAKQSAKFPARYISTGYIIIMQNILLPGWITMNKQEPSVCSEYRRHYSFNRAFYQRHSAAQHSTPHTHIKIICYKYLLDFPMASIKHILIRTNTTVVYQCCCHRLRRLGRVCHGLLACFKKWMPSDFRFISEFLLQKPHFIQWRYRFLKKDSTIDSSHLYTLARARGRFCIQLLNFIPDFFLLIHPFSFFKHKPRTYLLSLPLSCLPQRLPSPVNKIIRNPKSFNAPQFYSSFHFKYSFEFDKLEKLVLLIPIRWINVFFSSFLYVSKKRFMILAKNVKITDSLRAKPTKVPNLLTECNLTR